MTSRVLLSNNSPSVIDKYGILILKRLENKFLRIIGIDIENLTKHSHLFKQPTIRSVKLLKREKRSECESENGCLTSHSTIFESSM